ncbi:MAG TPA: hypothetical protein ENJ95_14940 [Bacteroidetes bacterium]|nr:hypothetical protein [Bacteroidota bacterium]
MEKFLTIIFVIVFEYCHSQPNYQTDTTIYSIDTRHECLVPKVEIGQKAIYKITKTDIEIENGDTTKNEKKENIFSYAITGKNDTAYFVELKIDDEMWESILFSKKQPNKNWHPEEVPQLIFQINNKGDRYELTNCEEVYDYILPFMYGRTEYYRSTGETGSWMRHMESLPEKAKDCSFLSKIFTGELNFLHQLYGTPVPVDGILKYKIEKSHEGETDKITLYMKVVKENLSKGNVKYQMEEDREKGMTLQDQFFEEMKEMAIRMDSTLAHQKIEMNSRDFNYLVFDKYNFPLKVYREINSVYIRGESKKEDFNFYEIEKVK